MDKIERAMENAERVMQDAADEHLRAFTLQMREKIGIEEIELNEPYLQQTIVLQTLKYLKSLEDLQTELDAALGTKGLNLKDFDLNESLESQVDDKLDLIEARQSLSIKQTLDSQRQQSFGIKKYIWRTEGDDRVRPSHDALEGEVRTWGDGIEPGEEAGCRCSAEPTAEGAGTPQPFDWNKLLDIALLLASITPQGRAAAIAVRVTGRLGSAARNALRGMTRARPTSRPMKPSSSPKPKDVLYPDGKPIGKPGNRPNVREVNGGEKAAQEIYKKLSIGGKPYKPKNYPGEGKRLPNGGWIGYRKNSKSGPPTIDIDINGIPYNKIKFPE